MTDRSEDCTRNPEAVLVAVLRRLRGRGADLARALNGRGLRVRITFTDKDARRETYRVILSAEGNVVLGEPEAFPVEDFASHIEFRCAAVDLRRFVLGELSLSEATEQAVMVSHVDVAGLADVRQLVADELRSVLAEGVR